jgi:hypothetical protein
MNTDARRAASRAYHAKRTEQGLRKVTLWLSPEARFKLDALKAAAGSKDKAADLAILAWKGPGAPAEDPPAKASKAPAPVKAKAPPAKAVAAANAAITEALASPPKVEVPLLQRKAFNPQQKKGGKT